MEITPAYQELSSEEDSKRAIISCEKAYIEIMEYPRAMKAVIVDAATGEQQVIEAGDTKNALQYELKDMENAIFWRRVVNNSVVKTMNKCLHITLY